MGTLTPKHLQDALQNRQALLLEELSWGFPLGELTDLTGRMGELFAALTIGGSMAKQVNQAGFDVLSPSGERVSVKTITSLDSWQMIYFSKATWHLVDRVVIVHLDPETAKLAILYDAPAADAQAIMSKGNALAICRLIPKDQWIIKPPLPESLCGQVWEACDELYTLGLPFSRKDVRARRPDLHPRNVDAEAGRWAKHHGRELSRSKPVRKEV
ncbi:hypothetical protein P3C80_23575 [Pseudomonas aeruginosa]|uniref:DUF6998 domain-containing protein n=1 Tax=Pseudomonas aeruginosa TaxID=287 RepID=UPI0021F23886|nr:hypothetical protein [Pseudomonas aeruginosa]MCV6105131.1 hypothetical protein [Pseudomonas aeruginosa]MDI2202472.1 hypothetical protein [Pseudomonas aeruginosa]MDY1166152.1 hypothetical protein [Pseudomonas aeruginosa]HBO4605237.1 hypothetical protein [Pseudomonas aeruginosa]